MSEPLLPCGRQSIGEEEIRAVTGVLRSDWITQGPVVPRLERAVADFCGSRHAVARGLVGVDYSGHPSEWNVLADIPRRHDLLTIDDACHALGAEYLGRRIGREADFRVS